MEREENDSAVSRPFHNPWKSIKPIPTFPPPRRRRSIYERIPKRSRPCCPPQTDPSGSSFNWKRLPANRLRSDCLHLCFVPGELHNTRRPPLPSECPPLAR